MYAKILFTAISGILFSAMSNPAVTAVPAGIQWNKTVHDFGTLRQGAKVSTTFTCYNKSDSVLIFENVQASCGCVIPGWSKAPLKPGDSSVLQVGIAVGDDGYGFVVDAHFAIGVEANLDVGAFTGHNRFFGVSRGGATALYFVAFNDYRLFAGIGQHEYGFNLLTFCGFAEVVEHFVKLNVIGFV